MAARAHPIFARFFAALGPIADRRGGLGERRDALLAGLAGRIIEVGAGSGLNFHRYPADVTEVLAVEPEPYLRGKAAQAARAAPVAVEVVDGIAERLPAADAAFDAGVASLVLCSVQDPDAALAELFRVIRPGGELRFFEHVAAQEPRQRRIQRGVDRVWPHLFAGCHTSRDTPATIERAGFQMVELDRFDQGMGRLDPLSPHALGRARRP